MRLIEWTVLEDGCEDQISIPLTVREVLVSISFGPLRWVIKPSNPSFVKSAIYELMWIPNAEDSSFRSVQSLSVSHALESNSVSCLPLVLGVAYRKKSKLKSTRDFF